MARKTNDKKDARVSVALSLDDRVRLEKFSHALGLTPSELVRQAVKDMLLMLENPVEKVTEEQSILAHRMEKLENRMAALLARVGRATAQTLYFTALPYRHGGLPEEPLTPKAMNHLWGQSGQFAGEWLKQKGISPERGILMDSDETQKPKETNA